MPRRRQFKEFEVEVDMALPEERSWPSNNVIYRYYCVIMRKLPLFNHNVMCMKFYFRLKYRSTWEFADGTRAANKIWRLKRTLCVCRVWAVGSWSVPDVLGSRGVRRHQQQTTRGREQQGQACPIF